MKLISWNVNGLRACVRKGFLEYFEAVDADIFCVQEMKLQAGQIDLRVRGLLSILELCVEKRVFGYSCIYKRKTVIGKVWSRGFGDRR